MIKLKNRGFTLVELIATMAILAIIMLMALPNIIGVVQSNKKTTYIEDAKKLVSLAEYKIRSVPTKKPELGSQTGTCFKLSDLTNDISDGPNGGTYDDKYTWVSVKNSTSDGIIYYVNLCEKICEKKDSKDLCEEKDSKYFGIKHQSIDKIDDATIVINCNNTCN